MHDAKLGEKDGRRAQISIVERELLYGIFITLDQGSYLVWEKQRCSSDENYQEELSVVQENKIFTLFYTMICDFHLKNLITTCYHHQPKKLVHFYRKFLIVQEI
jgi:hypothetical protein